MIKEILKIIESNSRITTKKVAAMTGADETEVKNIIKQAEKDRIILKYKTIIDWNKVEDEQAWALIEVTVSPQREVGFDAIAERIYKFPQAHTVYLLSGTYDLLVLAIGKNMHEIADFISQKLAPIEGIQGTVTHFLLKRYKEDGEILAGKGEVKRQQVVL